MMMATTMILSHHHSHYVCHQSASGLDSRFASTGESLSPRAGALQHGHVGASVDLSHLRMHARLREEWGESA